jgi:hypothetical protein
MRFLLIAVLCLFGVMPARATTYHVDLNTLPMIGTLVGPCYCGQGPLYEWDAPPDSKPGDTVNFGSVTIFSVFDNHSWGHVVNSPLWEYWNSVPGLLDQIYPEFNYQGVPTIIPAGIYRQSIGSSGIPLGSSQTYALSTEFGGDNLWIGWDGPGIYAPPVPEASTWAMLLLGFAGIGFLAYRRQNTLSASNCGEYAA